jgi:hypothetical protein
LADGHLTHHKPNIEFPFDIYPWGKPAIGGGLMLFENKDPGGSPSCYYKKYEFNLKRLKIA